MAASIFTCSTCRHTLPNDMYDQKRDGKYKRTCRSCLSLLKAKYNAKAAHAAMRDAKKIRIDLITSIYILSDPTFLEQALGTMNALIQAEAEAKSISPPVEPQ